MTASNSGSTPSARRERKRGQAAVDGLFLKLAIIPHRAKMVAALAAKAWAKSEHFELPIVGLPGISKVALFCWPEPLGRPRRVLVDVVRANETVLDESVGLTFDLDASERPAYRDETPPVVVEMGDDDVDDGDPRPTVLVVPGPDGPVTWRKVSRAGVEKEVQRLDSRGAPVLGLVDTGTHCYRMTCACGRVRYARSNGIHQIWCCRVCMRTIRLRRRALAQYKARYGQKR